MTRRRTVRSDAHGFHGPTIFIIALGLRLLHVWQMRDTLYASVLMGDSRGYDAWAERLATGDWLGGDVFYQAPLYPYFLGLIYAVFGRDLLIVRVIQAVLGALSAVALGDAARRLVSSRAGFFAGVMLALYPPAIFFDGLLQKSVLDVLFVCASLALIGRIVAEGGTSRRWLALGAVMGALSLTRENALVLVACVVIWALLQPRPPRARLAPALLLLGGLAMTLLPVALRNYAVGGGFYLTTSQFGSNLFIGNNERADGSYMSLRAGRGSPEYERVDATELAEQAVGKPLTPAEVSGYWTDRTLAFIRAEPIAWSRLIVRKARLLLSATEIIDTESLESHADYSWLLRLAVVWNFGVLLPLAIVGVAILWPQRQKLWIVAAMAVAYGLSVIAFFVVARYRYPIVPFVLIFAAAGVLGLQSFVRTAPRRRLFTTGAVAAAATIVSFWPLHTSASQRAITENNLGTALQEEGRVDEAVNRYRRALAFDPGYTPALGNLGTALRASGRVGEALQVYQEALKHRPEAPEVHYNLANALLAQGKVADAIAHYQRALDANPRFVDARNNLGLALEADGRLAEAIAAWRSVLAQDARSAQAHSNLGNALASQGDLRQAAAHLQQSIALDPANPGSHYDLGSVYLEGAAFELATTSLREAVRLKPEYPEAHNNLGIALASQGQMTEAIEHWQQALRLKPDFADAQRNLDLAQQRR